MDVRTVEKVVADLAKSNGGRVTRAELARRLGLRGNQAGYLLARFVRAGQLCRVGRGGVCSANRRLEGLTWTQ
jgi:hypothetical protein